LNDHLELMRDPVADALDDMAALGQHWTRNRERGRMPNGIRAAMLLVAREVLALDEMARRDPTDYQFGDLSGQPANGG
jgi:hypothetical protein